MHSDYHLSSATTTCVIVASWIMIPMTRAFGPSAGYARIVGIMTSQLGVNPLSSVDSLVLSDYNSDLGSRLCAEPPATATFVATDTAFTDKINYFGDPMVRTIVLLFGVVFLLLAGLTVLSKKMDAAIENVLVDFEEVMTSSPEFRDQWEEIELQLKFYDDEVETSQLRKQKMFEIMEELEEKEPMFMKRVSAKMAALNGSNK